MALGKSLAMLGSFAERARVRKPRRSVHRCHAFVFAVSAAVMATLFMPVHAVAFSDIGHGPSISDRTVSWPSVSDFVRVLSLRDHNTRVVILGASVLGLASGVIGSFMLLRKRALMGDTLSHATLPGICLAFIVSASLGSTGKSLVVLLIGGALSGSLGVIAVLLIRRYTRLKEDAALGIVLSVFFGLGVAMLGLIQKMNTGHAAGLQSFIYGKTASMLTSDALLIAITATIVALGCAAMFKEFGLLCFDEQFAASIGRPTVLFDASLMALTVLVTVIGLQAVGLILVVALLVIPPAAARFWTNHLPVMVVLAACIGAGSGFVGAGVSALVPRLPAGAIIVIVAASAFIVSMLVGQERGVLVRAYQAAKLHRTVTRQHLLRAMFEWRETSVRASTATGAPDSTDSTNPTDLTAPADSANSAASWEPTVPLKWLLTARSWPIRKLKRALNLAKGDGLLAGDVYNGVQLTKAGTNEAYRIVRNHRLWELYLITHADIAPSHVDRDADELEHVLGPDMVHELETILAQQQPDLAVPPSPHRLESASLAHQVSDHNATSDLTG